MSRLVKIGDINIGDGNAVAIQSMTNTKTSDIESTKKQLLALHDAGCEIARLSVPDEESGQAFLEYKKCFDMPLVADIHFDYRLAILAVENGADKIRINPGNIGSEQNVKKVVDAVKHHGAAIRVGVNGGSIQKDILQKYGNTAKALALSCIEHTKIVEKFGFTDIVLSVKSSSVFKTIESNRLVAEVLDYPIHVGVTEAGTYENSIIKSAGAFAPLLMEGIGDTIRISVTGDPVCEVTAAKKMLNLFGVRKFGVEVVSCPTCARTCINVEKLAIEVEKELAGLDKNIKIAVMGCAVNGPGEAKDADIGVAGGSGEGLIFVKGEKVKKVSQDKLLSELKEQIRINF